MMTQWTSQLVSMETQTGQQHRKAVTWLRVRRNPVGGAPVVMETEIFPEQQL